jgi:hypothetical protein
MLSAEVLLGEVLSLIAVEDQAVVVIAEVPTGQLIEDQPPLIQTPQNDPSYTHARHLSNSC